MKPLLVKLGWTLLWLLVARWQGNQGHWFRVGLATLVWLMLVWPAFQRAWGAMMSRVVMTALYFVGIAPFGLGVRLFSDPLRMKRGARDTHWVARAPQSETLADAARQG